MTKYTFQKRKIDADHYYIPDHYLGRNLKMRKSIRYNDITTTNHVGCLWNKISVLFFTRFVKHTHIWITISIIILFHVHIIFYPFCKSVLLIFSTLWNSQVDCKFYEDFKKQRKIIWLFNILGQKIQVTKTQMIQIQWFSFICNSYFANYWTFINILNVNWSMYYGKSVVSCKKWVE